MEIQEERIEDVPVLSLEGRIGYKQTPGLKDRLSQKVENGQKHIVLDIGEVDFLCSWAIGSILTTNGRLRKDAGGVYLTRIKPELKELLDLLGLRGTLKIYPTVEEAIRTINED